MTASRGMRTASALLLAIFTAISATLPTADAFLTPSHLPLATADQLGTGPGTPTPDPAPPDGHPDCGLCQYLGGLGLIGAPPSVWQFALIATPSTVHPADDAGTPTTRRSHHSRAPPVL